MNTEQRADLCAALRSYRQADAEGVMVYASRQACEEAATALEWHRANLERLIALIPSSCYMDPPDGGDVTVLEQFNRMAQDARSWREQQDRITRSVKHEQACEG